MNFSTMGWEYDLKTDIRFLQGFEDGVKKEHLLLQVNFIKSLFEQTDFSIEKNASIGDVSIEFVEKIKNNIL